MEKDKVKQREMLKLKPDETIGVGAYVRAFSLQYKRLSVSSGRKSRAEVVTSLIGGIGSSISQAGTKMKHAFFG